jgi:hypothetical protein
MRWILVKRQLSRRTMVNRAIGSYSIRFVVRHGAGAPFHAKQANQISLGLVAPGK